MPFDHQPIGARSDDSSGDHLHLLIMQFHFVPGDTTHTFTTIGRCSCPGRMGLSVSTGELAVRGDFNDLAYPES